MDSPQNTEQQLPPQQQKIDKDSERQDNQQENKAAQASRRSRKDIEGRDFVCGCGKKYLSYPALYTHIKTKHDGRQPQGTMKYSTTAPAKKSKTKMQEQHLNYLISLVKREDIKVLDLLVPRFSGSTPLSARLKSKILQKPITDTYHSLLKTTTSPLKVSKQTPLQQHLVAWLIGVGEFITQKLHDQYQWFARTVKQCYYQMGNEVYTKCFSKKDGGLVYVPSFKVQKVKYFPLICDFYIRFFLPYQYSELNANLMELILTDFCHWLNKRKCTFIEIVLNKEYKLTSPLKIQEDSKNDQQKGDDDQKQDLSQIIDPDSQLRQNKEEGSKQEKKMQSIADLELNQSQNIQVDVVVNDVEQIQEEKKQVVNEEAQNPIVIQQNQLNTEQNPPNTEQAQINIQQIQNNLLVSEVSLPSNQNNGSLKVHHNWSLQPQPASQSSQQIPQQQGPVVIHEQMFQSDQPQHQHIQANNNQDAHSQNL